MAKKAVLQFFYYVSPTIKLSKIKLAIHIYADTMPIHIYFHEPTSFSFGAIDKKYFLAQPGIKGIP